MSADVCDQVQDLLQGYVADQLEPADAGVVREHLAACAACTDEEAAVRELAAALREGLDQPEPPAGFADGVEGRLGSD